jgi:hypothetical protein
MQGIVLPCSVPDRNALIEEDRGFTRFTRRRRPDVLGCFLFATFCVVSLGYAYVRVRCAPHKPPAVPRVLQPLSARV